jgi:hypothetical protein
MTLVSPPISLAGGAEPPLGVMVVARSVSTTYRPTGRGVAAAAAAALRLNSARWTAVSRMVVLARAVERLGECVADACDEAGESAKSGTRNPAASPAAAAAPATLTTRMRARRRRCHLIACCAASRRKVRSSVPRIIRLFRASSSCSGIANPFCIVIGGGRAARSHPAPRVLANDLIMRR